jgi:hypothetical protein
VKAYNSDDDISWYVGTSKLLSPHVGSLCLVDESNGTNPMSCIPLLFPILTEISARRFLCLLLHFGLLPWLILRKMEATCSSKMPVDFQPPTQRYIPEGTTFYFPVF